MIVKAEILWTRECPLECSYCAMPNDLKRAPVDSMIQGSKKLRELGCRFYAIYGASPFFDFDGLPIFIGHAERIGITTTVIVDGFSAPRSKDRFAECYEKGLRSLTVSYDTTVESDKWVRAKAMTGLSLARWAKSEYPDLRDIQLIATVTRENVFDLIEQVPHLVRDEGFWFSFDLVHKDRGQPGTKCRGDAKGYRFEETEQDIAAIQDFAKVMIDLKRETGRVHQSEDFLSYLYEIPVGAVAQQWTCANPANFPSWLTIDADGTVRPCDDFADPEETLKVWDLTEYNLEMWRQRNLEAVQQLCPGCLWSTHWDADAVKSGHVSFEEYVHTGG